MRRSVPNPHLVLVLALMLTLVPALGGCDQGADEQPTDAAVDAPRRDCCIDPPAVCDPLAPPGMAGCAAGLKCTWITITPGSPGDGRLGCVPDGNVALDQACMRGAPGETTGYDNCQAGAVCSDGLCADICSVDDNVANGPCAAGRACVKRAGLFSSDPNDIGTTGTCARRCDPLTQQVEGGGACPTTLGCYPFVDRAVCARAGTLGRGELITGPAFVNVCRPGLYPRPRGATSELECGALCRPADVFAGNNVALEGGVAPSTCQAAGAPAPAAAGGESCRSWWLRNPNPRGALDDIIGFCMVHDPAARCTAQPANLAVLGCRPSDLTGMSAKVDAPTPRVRVELAAP